MDLSRRDLVAAVIARLDTWATASIAVTSAHVTSRTADAVCMRDASTSEEWSSASACPGSPERVTARQAACPADQEARLDQCHRTRVIRESQSPLALRDLAKMEAPACHSHRILTSVIAYQATQVRLLLC